MVGGYRLVRKLGSGERGEVFLGHAGSEAAAEAPTAAVKIFRASVSRQSIGDEIGVLAGTSSPHLLRLLDVATTPDGRPCAILPRLSSVSLARLLMDRPGLGVGESITILAPLCLSIVELHNSRVCHGAIGSSSVLFDQRGAPVLACFGRASGFGRANGSGIANDREAYGVATPAELAAEPRIAADLADLAMLAKLVLSRVTSSTGSARSVTEVLDWLQSPGLQLVAGQFAEELAERLFELAPAAPVDFAQPIVASFGGLPARMVTSGPPAALQPVAGSVASRDSAAGQAWRLLRRLTAALPSVPVVAEHITRVRTAFTSVRKRFWIAGAAGAVAIALALVLTQLLDRTDAVSAGNAPTPTAAGSALPQGRAAVPSSTASTQRVPSGSAVDSIKKAIAADDPVAAAEALLQNREECILKRSVLCLDGVDQANSSALDDDGYLIRSLRDGGAADARASLSGAKVVLSERLGDSALLTVQDSQSPAADGTALLIIKGESGWRIRDFLAN